MDQLTDSSNSPSSNNNNNIRPSISPSSSHRSILAIDLNQIPSPPETLPSPSFAAAASAVSPTSLVRSFHENPPLPEGPAAEIPGGLLSCAACGGPGAESAPDRIVCDACERGFHFGCAGVVAAVDAEEWVCRDCLREGFSSRRWQLGRTEDGNVLLLDINAAPPSDVDVGDAVSDSRKLGVCDNPYGGYASVGLMSYPSYIYSGNGFHKPSVVRQTPRLDFQDILYTSRSKARSSEEIGYRSQLGRMRSSNTSFRLPSMNPNEVLKSLKDFVSERHGLLEEGWRVEFRQSKNGYETYAVYCAPDGRIFETMSDVASYLGLASNGNSLEPDIRGDDISALRRNGLHLPKRRKLTKLPIGNGLMENKDIASSGFRNNLSSNLQNEHLSSRKCEKKLVHVEALREEKGATDVHQFHEGLPLQYEDFFVLTLGKADARALYHDPYQIWPVGYRSCWHDKLTGSLFLCHVLDGGDSGPVFKLKRFPCSALPIPYGSTILRRRRCVQSDVPKKDEGHKINSADDDCCIEMILSDPTAGSDSLSWLESPPNKGDDQNTSHSEAEAHSTTEPSQDQLACSSSVGENIGEFSVDGNSASLVWSILSQKVVDACRQTYKQSGSLKFFCKHAKEGLSSFYDIVHDKNKATFSALEKFCSLLGSLKVPSVVTDDDELDPTIDSLKHWLSPDRFGLDVEFVQELVEQGPNVNKCTRYQSLKRRKEFSKVPLVRNGLLLINGKSLEQCQEDSVIDSLYKDYRINRAPARVIHSRPPGKHLGVKLPPHLVGDVLQVWEILHRFHGILSLEPLNFDELEAELISPWFENSSPIVSPDEGFPGDQAVTADGSVLLNEQASLSSDEIEHPEDNRLLEIQTSAMREESRFKLALSMHSKCAGLRKAHMSLLDVLVSELQIKAAAMVDPSIDGESRSRRGRRKDVDSSILAIRPKLNLLPVNDITWPELARRYILAMLSMDGNPDSAENGIREFGNVFRCLQGDGGVLCGSLVGVAGIEADALLLSEAIKRIYGCCSSENDHLIIEDDDPEPVSTSGMGGGGDGKVPEWAQVLEPVRKLPTNVGTRIRKCVYEALEKNPPDWARKKLEHSISREVYKGNASGPTKKAVLSVLADAISQASEQKIIKERKKKTILSISDIIMRKCRILLRLAASADDEKVFCNLLGRNLTSSSENDDEGLLGSPAMVSRPLDFRTIDLRLAAGAYCGFHEAFLEDVRELWKNIAIAHAEQSDLVEVAERLSQNFESLYQEEVVALVDKLKEYSKLEQLSPEMKKEVDDVVASTSDIPKAPWDEGVCKVCGVDKDDDSVLLCDTCDAEYHTYCLNPPLARIPEGNWYCPSCVSGVSILPSILKGVQRIGHRRRRKYHGDGIRNYLEELARLSAVMEQKDYWEFSVEERILLLKFLCDDVLNAIVIRQHLELCFETSADLQQKLRTSYSEWKSLKLREDILAAKVTKLGLVVSNITGDGHLEGNGGKVTDQSSCEEVQLGGSDKRRHISSISAAAAQASGDNHVKKDVCKSQVDMDCQAEHVRKIVKVDKASAENFDLHEQPLKRQKSLLSHECSAPNSLPNEISSMDSEPSLRGKLHEHHGLDVSAVCKSEDGVTASGLSNGIAAESTSCSTSNELLAMSEELKTVQKELSVLQRTIASAESQLLSFSIRTEYLGTDSFGRLYWAAAQTGAHPWLIVDCTMALQPRAQLVGHASTVREGIFFETPLGGFDGHLSLGGSSASCPFVYGRDCAHPTCSQWIYYQSEAEIRDLLMSLNDYDVKERELKDSILHWQKPKFHELCQNGKEGQVLPVSTDRNDVPKLLLTKAYNVLERKFGPFFRMETLEVVKKRSKRSRGTNDENLYRCECLEPVWLSRSHCFSCHRTFYTTDELDKHSDGKCKSCSPVSGKGNACVEPSAGSSGRKYETQQYVQVAIDKVQSYKTAGAEPLSVTEYQNEASPSPYRFEEISTKFVTQDSIKELVNGIGLIGNEGIPSFVTSLSPYLSDPMLLVKEGTRFATDQLKIPDNAVGLSNQIAGKGHVDNVAAISARTLLQIKHGEHSESGKPIPESRGGRPKKAAALPMVSDAYCTVPESSLKPVVGKAAQILRQLKICLLDMEAALPEESFRQWKVHQDKRRAWHAFVKTADTIFEMVQATIVLEDMIMSEFLKNEWWYWSSLSAAVKISTVSSLALRIFALDNAILYDRTVSDSAGASNLKSSYDVDQQSPSNVDSPENSKQVRRTSKRRRDGDS